MGLFMLSSSTSVSNTTRFHLIPKVGLCLKGMARINKYLLFGRVNLNWRNIITIAGMITTVSVIALAFFYNMKFIAFGCVIALAVQLFAARYVNKYEQLKKLEDVVANLTNTNGVLAQTKQKLDGVIQLTQGENSKLTSAVKDLEKTNIELRANNARMEGTVRDLNSNNERLEGNIRDLNASTALMEKHTQDLTQQNLAYANNNRILDENAQRLHQLCDRVKEDLLKRENELNKLVEEKLNLGGEISRLQGVIEGNKLLSEKLTVLNEFEKNIKEHQKVLEKLKLEFAEVSILLKCDREELDKTNKILAIEQAKLHEISQTLQQDTHKLHIVTQAYKEAVRQYVLVKQSSDNQSSSSSEVAEPVPEC